MKMPKKILTIILIIILFIMSIITTYNITADNFCQDIEYINNYHQNITKELIVEIKPLKCDTLLSKIKELYRQTYTRQ